MLLIAFDAIVRPVGHSSSVLCNLANKGLIALRTRPKQHSSQEKNRFIRLLKENRRVSRFQLPLRWQ